MRPPALATPAHACVVSACLVAILSLAALSGCGYTTRVQTFVPGPNGNFLYSVHTNTVMTENSDGASEQIRRDWLAQTLGAQGMCNGGYVVYQRDLVIPPQRPAFSGPPYDLAFGNGGNVVYAGSCL